MTREQFLQAIKVSYKEATKLIEDKNRDYGADEDPFRNFRVSELVGVSPARAILVRMSDKLARISNLIDKEATVKDETISDTLLDLANYATILKVFLENKSKK